MVFALFALNPLWWALGFGDLSWCMAAVPLWIWVLTRRNFVIPPSVGLFITFILWAMITIFELDKPSRLFAFGFRTTSLLTAAALAIYVFNERRVTREKFVDWVAWFWIAAVIGGYIGLAFPKGHISTTLASLVLPKGITSNELVKNMVRPGFAQQQDQFGVNVVRPKTLFPFTNEWGGNLGLLTPFFVLSWVMSGVKKRRNLGILGLVLAMVPMIKSVNRGLWISLILFAIIYSVRAVLGGRPAVLVAMIVGAIILTVIIFTTPLKTTIVERLSSERSTDARAGIYEEAFAGAKNSPIFGNGGPRPSKNPYSPPIGTHGQFWLVMYAHGFVGLALYLAWSGASIMAASRRVDRFSIVMSVTVIVGATQMFFYNLLPQALPIILVALGLACRPPDQTSRWQPRDEVSRVLV
jgi:polysaccharide biosynthesis protein PslJ